MATLLGAQHRRDAFVGRRAVVDDQYVPAVPSATARVRRFDPDAREPERALAQFVDQRLQPRQRAHARDQRQIVDRLGEKFVGAGFQPAHAVGRLVERRHHHHRDMAGLGCLQPPADLEAVDVRHHDVEQNQVALGALPQISSASAPLMAVRTS